jgi:WD40 repeat protein
VNFLGPNDEYVVSGSDDGNWFMWDKKSGVLHDIFEGDGTVVNVIEGHPYLPLAAVSGIDHTVKVILSNVFCHGTDVITLEQLFAPTSGQSAFSRIHNSASIIELNTETSRQRLPVAIDFTHLLMTYRLSMLGTPGSGLEPQCSYQ